MPQYMLTLYFSSGIPCGVKWGKHDGTGYVRLHKRYGDTDQFQMHMFKTTDSIAHANDLYTKAIEMIDAGNVWD